MIYVRDSKIAYFISAQEESAKLLLSHDAAAFLISFVLGFFPPDFIDRHLCGFVKDAMKSSSGMINIC